MKSTTLFTLLFSIGMLLSLFACKNEKKLAETPANILFIIADDWSHPHSGIYGDTVVKTPHFNRIANEGAAFDHAYVSSPSCTPSRAAILSGQHFWRLQEGGNLYGPLRPEHPVFTDLLEEAGFHVGYTDKGWGPGIHEGRPRNPAGDKFESFAKFLEKRPEESPFCFWMGSYNPHRGYKKGSGAEAGIAPEKIQLPACFPDSDPIRNDVADYYKEVQDFDGQIGEVLQHLDATGELDNTLIVVTSDNGMPFPRCKSNLYDMGTRVPLAIRWGDRLKKPLRSQDFVSLTDLAPTFLEAVNLPVPKIMTGRSLMNYLNPEKVRKKDDRKQVFFGKERHVPGQESGDWGGYPMRAIRTHDFLYIKNFRPDRWPSGTPDYQKATFYPAYYADVDGAPTKTYMINHREDNEVNAKLFTLAFEKRPGEELYDLKKDPDQLNNVATEAEYAVIKKQLEAQLLKELKHSEDPRVVGGEEIFESFPYTGGTPVPDAFKKGN